MTGSFTLSEIFEWESCINDQRTRGDTQQEKQQNMLKECCNLVLQCKKPNEWLKSNWDDNKYNLYCPTPKKIDHPHFGDIKPADGVM